LLVGLALNTYDDDDDDDCRDVIIIIVSVAVGIYRMFESVVCLYGA